MDSFDLTLCQARELLIKKELSSVELTKACLDRIQAHDDRIGAFITVDHEGALEQAQRADALIARGNSPAGCGIPIALKDLIITQDMKTTCGSRMLDTFIPQYDATVVEKLRQHDMVIVGKTNMDEFAMGSSNENSAFFPVKNPWNTDYIPGGSSGGSAAAVASGFCTAALGSDTGGSIRQPGSHCGVVGLKPTYGRVSRFGLVSYASSLDQIGPITKDVKDAAFMLDLIAGHDSKDSTSAHIDSPDFSSCLDDSRLDSLKGITAGIPREYLDVEGIDPDVKTVFSKARQVLEDLGVNVVEISLPHAEYVVAAYYIIAPCEASSNLARYDGVRYGYRSRQGTDLIEMYRQTKSTGFGPEVQNRIILGTYALSAGYYDAYYGRASRVRTLIYQDFEKAFETCDIILSPVAPTPAFKIGEKIDDPLTMYLSDIFTLSANMAGIPGISVPAGFSAAGLPIGIQMMAKRFDETSLLKAGRAFENARNLTPKFPSF